MRTTCDRNLIRCDLQPAGYAELVILVVGASLVSLARKYLVLAQVVDATDQPAGLVCDERHDVTRPRTGADARPFI